MRHRSGEFPRAVIWLLLCTAPFLPLYGKLLSNLLSDTPEAYLCVVPVLAYAWAFRQFAHDVTEYQDDKELNVILGGSLSVLVLFIVLWGPRHFPLTFYGRADVLFMWPLWSIAMGWLLFGVGVTRWLWKPMAYLLLAVPVLYSGLAGGVIGDLQFMTGNVSRWLLQGVSWVTWYGAIGNVIHGAQSIMFSLVTACTGADSMVAVVLVLIYLWPLYSGRWTRKSVWILAGLIYAFVANLLRITLLIGVLHEFGAGELFTWVHALLGLVLFALLSVVLLLTGRALGLVRREAKEQGSSGLALAGKLRIGIGVFSTVILTIMIGVAWWNNQTNTWKSVVTSRNMSVGEYPSLAGYYATGLGAYDDSSVLGTGTQSYAVAYSNRAGSYYRVEAWTTPAGWRLQQYSVNDCLTFHGDTILSRNVVQSPADVRGSLYTVSIPPLTRGGPADVYAVVSYTFRTEDNLEGQPVYERIEISSPLRQGVKSSSKPISTAPLVKFSSVLLGSVVQK